MFEVTGTFREKNADKKFTKKIDAGSEKRARELAVALFGSKHGAKKRHVVITGVKEA